MTLSTKVWETVLGVELTKLRDEIAELKKCQIDFMKLAVVLFGFIVSLISALIKYLPSTTATNSPFAPAPRSILAYIFVLSIAPLVFPYISWVIIHKCRSIFRIVAYLRLLEDVCIDRNAEERWYFGYERLHKVMKGHPWLTPRVTSFSNPLRMWSNDFRSYKKIAQAGIESYDDWKASHHNGRCPDPVSVDGIDKKEECPYIGNYYGKMLFLIRMLGAICAAGGIALCLYAALFVNLHQVFRTCFVSIAAFLALWSIYHHRVGRRYLDELRYRPFSIDAHYDMWRWATWQMLHGAALPCHVPLDLPCKDSTKGTKKRE